MRCCVFLCAAAVMSDLKTEIWLRPSLKRRDFVVIFINLIKAAEDGPLQAPCLVLSNCFHCCVVE